MGNVIKDLTGKQFGKLKVLRLIKNPKIKDTFHGSWWLCKCDCGNEKEIRGTELRNGHSKSCGCRSKATQFKKLDGTEINLLYSQYQRSAKDRDLIFEIDFDSFVKLVGGNCFYCGNVPSQTLDYYKHSTGFTYNGIDRINPLKGYVLDNCVPCCSKCNYAKRSMVTEEFYNWIKQVYDNLKRKGEIE